MNNQPDRDRHKAFIYEAEGSETAILMVHGIFGSPVQFAGIAEMLHKQGSTVMAVLLPGHGGSAKDFSGAGASQWQREVHEAAEFLRRRHRHVTTLPTPVYNMWTMDFV